MDPNLPLLYCVECCIEEEVHRCSHPVGFVSFVPLQLPHLTLRPSPGIKIAYKTFKPACHTHFLTKGITASTSLHLAAMATAFVASPKWFEAFMKAGAPNPFPADMPEAPGPQLEGETDKEYERRHSAWENALLALNPDIGADATRWFGHCVLEEMWAGRPDVLEDQYACEVPVGLEHWTSKGWTRREERRQLFKGILFVSFSQNVVSRLITVLLARD